MSVSGWSVANAVWRILSIVSNSESCAPGCSRSRRTISRVPLGQASSPVISTTVSVSRATPLPSRAGDQHSSGTHTSAARSRPSIACPIENAEVRSRHSSVSWCAAPAVNHTRTEAGDGTGFLSRCGMV